MKLKNSDMHCKKASVQLQGVILRWFWFIIVYLYCYCFIISQITLSVLLSIHEDGNNLPRCYNIACCFILKIVLLLLGSVMCRGDKHLMLAELEHLHWYPGGAYKTRQLLLKYLSAVAVGASSALAAPNLWPPRSERHWVCLSQENGANFCNEKIEVLLQRISTLLLLTAEWWDLGEGKIGTVTHYQ